ncbi:hypothetical protein EVA_15800 [gut metagenome]|uniref:Uncharacterized protein n=1 Tax=gut metagenome TaxID=749906 RepID=J9FNR4_9ZZZZ
MGQKQSQQSLFIRLCNLIHTLNNPVYRTGGRIHLNLDGLFQDPGSQLFNFPGHGCAEQQILPLLRQIPQYPFHIMHKAHIQHPVGLIQHKNL